MTDLILYSTENGRNQTDRRAQQHTILLARLETANLFEAISVDRKNDFEDGDLDAAATVKESVTVQMESNHEVQRPSTLRKLEALESTIKRRPTS